MTALSSTAAMLDLRVRNGDVAWAHVESEYLDVVDDILATLVPEEPYAYTVSPQLKGDGSIPRQHFVSSAADLRASYEDLHRVSHVRKMEAIAEFRGQWYVFNYGLGEGLAKATGDVMYTPTAVLFPTMGKMGITGELFWMRSASGAPYTGGRETPLAAETAILARHEELLNGLRAGDIDAVANLFHPDSQTGVRDYVTDSGTLAGLHSRDELRDYLDRFYKRFQVHEIQLVNRLATDWFAFAELLWVVSKRDDPGQKLYFYTAEFGEVRPDGLFASRIGHGTEMEAA